MATPTAAQVETLLNFLEEHRDLARGLLRSVKGRARSHRLWQNICTTLNAMGGCTKSTKQWKKAWADKKYLAKKAAAAARRSASATGGGPSTAPQLSHCDLRVISIIGDGYDEPTTARMPAFTEQSQEPTFEVYADSSPPLQEDLSQHSVHLPTESRQPEPAAEPASQPSTSQASVGVTMSSNRTPRTRRPRALRHQSECRADGPVWERLFSLEEERKERELFRNEKLAEINEKLGGIMLALQEMGRLIQQVTGAQSRPNE